MAELLGAPTSPSATAVRRSGAALAVATVVSNLLGYAFAIVLSRSLGPGGYGALASLLALGLIGSVPAIALQLLVARETAEAPGRSADWVRTSAVLGLTFMVLVWLTAPFATAFLELSGPVPVLWLGVTLLPVTVTGALQGVLLGARRYGALAASYLLLSGLRLAGAGVAALLGWSVSGAIGAAAVGTALSAVAVARITTGGGALPRTRAGRGDGLRQHVRLLVAAASATAAILLLTNLDVVLARHYLPAEESGQYGVGALFAKAAFWAPHFLAVMAFPMLVARGGRRRSLLITTGLTLAIGAVVVLGALLFAGPLLELTVGTAYARGAELAPQFAVLGVLAALLQLLLFAGLARRTRRAEAFVWSGITVQVVLVAGWFHGSAEQVLATSIAVCAALVAVIVADELRPGAAAWRAAAGTRQ